MRHLHLDAIGGIAGDMFVAALLDAEPARADDCLRIVEAVAGVPCRLLRHRDAVLAGARFSVAVAEAPECHAHNHTEWATIRARLVAAALPDGARRHALGIFSALAEAEAQVHGIAPAEVTFHEVGAVDSIADIVAAGWLIAAQADADGDATWSVGPLPLGGGRIRTAHGVMPLPAPATALLLRGFLTIDDGVAGERVTPTGAAILRHLGAGAAPPTGARALLGSGTGFGTRALPGLPNMLRVLISERAPAAATQRRLAVIEFEVDDQTPEDLAVALDHIRKLEGVFDVLQMPAIGKKGRSVAHVQILADPAALEPAVTACFAETSTIGLRTRIADARALPRATAEVAAAGRTLRVKRVQRPGGRTAKADSDDLKDVAGFAARRRLRAKAEQPDD